MPAARGERTQIERAAQQAIAQVSRGLGVERIRLDKPVDHLASHGNHNTVTPSQRLVNKLVRMSGHDRESIELIVAKCAKHLVHLAIGNKCKIRRFPTEGAHHCG